MSPNNWMIGAAVTLAVGMALPAFAQGEKKDVSQGQQLFMSQSCHFCHSIDGKGNKKNPLDGVGSKLSEDQIHMWITDPKGAAAKANVTMKPPAMTSFASKLSKDQIDALADYLETLKKP